MRRILLFCIFATFTALALLPTSASAQTLTQVSATITDPNGLKYSNATITITLAGGGPSPQVTPCAVSPCTITPPGPITTGPTGAFTVALWANASINPGGTTWCFFVTEPGVPLPWGTGPQSFSTCQTISGSSQSLSSAMSALAPALTPAFSGGSATPCTTAAGAIQYNLASAFGCNGNFIYTASGNLFSASAGGVYTVTQWNPQNTFLVGTGCSPATELIGLTDAVDGVVCVPSTGVTNNWSTGVTGFVDNGNSSGTGAFGNVEGVGEYGAARCHANNTTCIGQASSSFDVAGGLTGVFIEGNEVDVGVNNNATAGVGFLMSFRGNGQPTADNFPAFWVQSPEGTGEATSGFKCDDGALAGTVSCLEVGSASGSGSSNSQFVHWDARNPSGPFSSTMSLWSGAYFLLGSSPAVYSGATVSGYGVQFKSTTNLSANQLVKIDTANPSSWVVCTTSDSSCDGFIMDQLGSGTGGNCQVGNGTCAIMTVPGSRALGILGTGTCTIGQFVIVDTTTNGDIKCTGSQPAQGAVIGKALTNQSTVGQTVAVLTKFQ
jgi:hypothetical protein